MAATRNFNAKTVVVTGAAGGMGLAFAKRFAQAGAQIAMLDVKETEVKAAARHLAAKGSQTMALGCDVSKEERVTAAVNHVTDRFGGVDVLINNAGISARAAFEQTDLAVFRKVMEINFYGALYATKAALNSLKQRQGLIITISSLAGFSPLLGRTAYSASKHALHGLFDSLRCELKNSGVGVLMVCPGFTATGIGTSALDGDGAITRHPQSTVGRAATPQNVAEQVFQAASKNRRLLVLTPIGKLTRLVNTLSPRLYDCLMARSLRKELER